MTATESTREAFLADIIAHPDDDTPRLIFADWLDDHGEEERAEFIRVQCRLAEFDPARRVINIREPQLSPIHDDRWLYENRHPDFDRVTGYQIDGVTSASGTDGLRVGDAVDISWRHDHDGTTGLGVPPIQTYSRFDDCIIYNLATTAPMGKAVAIEVRTGGPPDPHREERARLKEVATGLFRGDYPMPGYLWAGEPLNKINDAEYTFRRGFVEEVKCDSTDWIGHGATLVKQHPIRKVRFADKGPVVLPDGRCWFALLNAGPGTTHVPADVLASLLLDYHRRQAWIVEEHQLLMYPSQTDAEEAISYACLAWAKSLQPSGVSVDFSASP